jgi:N6-L-threonylcarbamoyladenine synthase
MILALETSCDETAAAISNKAGQILASQISTQIELHRPYGGVIPELASRNHILHLQRLVKAALREADVSLEQIECFAATAGPGLVSSLLMGNTAAKALAVSCQKPFLAVNHLEGHLLSPFIGKPEGVLPSIALIVSGGHTMLLHLRGVGDYEILGRTRDDAAGEAFDKAAKMLGLPYPGGPQMDLLAKSGNRAAYEFPRSMLHSGDYAFSFSGLKTSLLYLLPKLQGPREAYLADVCASFQESIVDVLVEKTMRAAKQLKLQVVSVSGGVSCNSRLREALQQRCQREGFALALAEPSHTTDNAAMIAYAAVQRWKRGETSSLSSDVDPNLSLV